MCRNIKRLRQADRQPSEAELRDAALQFVRKISGFRQPSRVNELAFEAAVDEVTEAAAKLFRELAAPRAAQPRDAAS